MNRIFDFDGSASLSSDSGMESAENTRSSSATSVTSLDDWQWCDSSEFIYSLSYDDAFWLVQNFCIGLMSNDMLTLKSSAQILFHMCRSGFSEVVLSFFPVIFGNLKVVLATADISKHPDLIHNLSGIFYYLTENDSAAFSSPPETYIAFVAKLLSFPLESVLYYTVAGLHNLLKHKSLREKFRTPLIIILLIQILWTCLFFDKSFHPPVTCNPCLAFASSTSLSKFISIVCDNLYLLAHGNEMSKRLIHAKQGVVPLLYFVHTYQFEKIQGVCVRLLRILSTHPQTKRDILKNDPTLQLFKYSVNSTFQPLSLDAFWTLRNLSDQCASLASHQINEVSELLLLKLKDVEESLRCRKTEVYSPYDLQYMYTISRCISGTLANFTCRNPFTKLFLVEKGAVPLLSRLLTFTMDELSSHPTLCRTTVFGGPCMAPPKYDPIPPSLLSCLCGRRSVPLSTLQTTVDCVEATLRCLSHLTSSHQLANEAIRQLSYDWEDYVLCDDKGVCWIFDLLQLTLHEDKVHCNDHSIQPTPEQWDALDSSQVFQLIKVWLALARNRLAGGIWRHTEQEAALRSAVHHLELSLLPLIVSLDISGTFPDLQDTVDSCRQLFEAIRQL